MIQVIKSAEQTGDPVKAAGNITRHRHNHSVKDVLEKYLNARRFPTCDVISPSNLYTGGEKSRTWYWRRRSNSETATVAMLQYTQAAVKRARNSGIGAWGLPGTAHADGPAAPWPVVSPTLQCSALCIPRDTASRAG